MLGNNRIHTGVIVMGFFGGSSEIRENVSTLRPEQEGIYDQLTAAAKGKRGAGGAFGTAADYYMDLLSNNSQDYQNFANPMLRQYNEEIVPGLSEQFAGMGAGGLSSSGFRNAQLQGATDLSERLGALRSQLRQQGVQGLQNLGTQGLQSYSQNMVTQPGSEGFLSSMAPILGGVLGSVGGPMGTAFGSAVGNWLSSSGKAPTNSSPYGGAAQKSSPQGGGFQLPNFLQR